MQENSSEFKSDQNSTAAAEPQLGHSSSIKRRSTRLQVAIPIVVRWQDEAGTPHAEKAFTLMVSKHGAEIAVPTKLAVGTEIEVENQGLKRSAKCRVVWTRERRSPNSPFETGLGLMGPENIWGVKFPPQDWDMNESAQNGTQHEDGRDEAPSRDAEATSSAPQSAGQNGEPRGAEGETPAASAPEAASREQDEDSEPVVELTSLAARRLRQAQDEAVAEAAEGLLRERLDRGAEEIGQLVAEAREQAQQFWAERRQQVSDEAAAAREQGQQFFAEQKQQATALVAESVSSAAQVLRQAVETSTGMMKGEAANLRGEYAKLAEEAAKTRAEISSSLAEELRSKDQLRQAAEGLTQARADLSALIAEGERSKEDLKRTQEEFHAAISETQQKGLEGLANRLAAERDEMETVAKKTLASLQSAGDDAMVRLNAETNKVKEDLEKVSADYRTSLAESSATLQESFRHYLDLQVDVWKTETQDKVKTIKESVLRELSEGLRAASDETLESASLQIHRQVEDAQDLLAKELSDSRIAAIEEAKRQFASESRQMEEAARSLSADLRSSARTVADETEARITAIGNRAVEAIQAENSRLGDAWRESAEGIFHETAEKQLQDFQSRLRDSLSALRGPVLEEVEKQAQDLKERAVKDASSAIHQQIGLGAVVLKEWADQATARVEASFQKQLAEFENRLAEASRAMLENNRRQSEADVQSLRQRMLEAARLLEPPAGPSKD